MGDKLKGSDAAQEGSIPNSDTYYNTEELEDIMLSENIMLSQ